MVSDFSLAILNRINETVLSKSEDSCSQILKCERIKNIRSDMKYLEKCSNSESCEKMCSSKERSKPGKRRMGYREQYRTIQVKGIHSKASHKALRKYGCLCLRVTSVAGE